jgi:hypothetical protein
VSAVFEGNEFAWKMLCAGLPNIPPFASNGYFFP